MLTLHGSTESSQSYTLSMYLDNEPIQLSVVDANRTRPPCERGDFVLADVDGAWSSYS
jgi:hypothetical protein